ncbi:Hypothetical_protein [Hexamita inflata]|uniref:Hypothetical_protein n=1 Tax=Hexamita inflata TaxID=28002 RepID=A0ABP1JE44_9EUKA
MVLCYGSTFFKRIQNYPIQNFKLSNQICQLNIPSNYPVKFQPKHSEPSDSCSVLVKVLFYYYSRINFTFLYTYQMTTNIQKLQEEYDKYMEIANSFKEEPELHKDECKCSKCQRQKYNEAYNTASRIKGWIQFEERLLQEQEHKEQLQKQIEQCDNAPKRIFYSQMASSYQDQ